MFGITTAHHSQISAWIWLSLAAIAGVSGLRFRWILLLAISLGFAGIHAFRTQETNQVAALWLGRDPGASIPVSISGTVVEQPYQGRNNQASLTVKLDSLSHDKIAIPARNRIQLWAPNWIRQGDRIKASGRLSQLPGPRNPGEFNRRNYARNTNGIVADLDLPTRFQIEVIGVSRWHRLFHYAIVARNWVGSTITHGLERKSPAGGILKAMVLGARQEASPQAEEAFRLSGALHIFAVSGLHVGIFGMVIWLLLRTFGVPRMAAIFVIAACVLCYAFITGLRPSAVRAALMTTIFLAGFTLRRSPRLLNSLGFAALMILIVDSRQLFSVGFQLSFSVLAAISFFGPIVRDFLYRQIDPDPFIPTSLFGPWHRFGIGCGRRVSDIAAISVSAWVGSLPLIWWYFGLFTPIGMLANCVLVPIAWMVICFATISVVATGAQLIFISAWLNQLNSWLVLVLQSTASFFAQIPGGHYEVIPLADTLLAKPSEPGMVVFDLQRSCGPQAIHVRDAETGRKLTWIIDCGSETGYSRIIRPWLREQSLTRLDGFIATHGDTKHIGAAPLLIDDYRPQKIVSSQLPSMSSAYRAFEQFKADRDVSALQIAAGTGIQISDEAKIEILFPPRHHRDPSYSDDKCLVLRVEWNGFRILSMGDSGFETEKWLLANVPASELTADVLTKSHHVSDFSGLPEFIYAVNPKAVITTNDSFPVNETLSPLFLDSLAKKRIELFDQAKTGAVELRVSDDVLTVSGFLNQQKLLIERKK